DRLRGRGGASERVVNVRAIFERHLFPPLRFACRNGGERAANLRDLARLCGVAAEKAARAGAEEQALAGLVAAARAFDEAPAAGRAEALRAVLGRLGDLVDLPPDLASFLGHTEGSAAAPAAAPAPEPRTTGAEGAPVPPSPPTPASDAPEILRLEVQDTAAPPPPPRRPTASRRKEAAPEASAAPARIVVPAYAGPLARLPLSTLPGVGPRLEAAFAKKGIASVAHLLFDLPRAYQDRRRIQPIRELVPGERGLTAGRVVSAQEIFVRRSKRKLFRVVLQDDRGDRLALTFFHTWPALVRRFEKGKRF